MVYYFIDRFYHIKCTIIDPINRDVVDIPFLDPASVDQVSRNSMQPMTEGHPVDPTAVPKRICCRKTAETLPASLSCRGVRVVSELMRDIVERHEPGIHQFLPVDFYRPKATEPYARRYWMVVCRRIDSADPVHTTMARYPSGVWQSTSGGKFVFSRAAIGSAHLWRDPWIAGSLLCSQALGDALIAAKLKNLPLDPLEEV